MARCVLYAEVPGFYAAVERADDPSLTGRPVIVGGDPRKRGRVQAASSDALAAGVALDMPVLEALRHCPRAKAVRTDMARYRAVSRRLFAVLREGFPALEPFGLAAAYADLSRHPDTAEELAGRMLAAAEAALGLPLRVGLGAGKFLARLAAAEVAGERGVRRVADGDEAAFLAPLPATRLDGVGRKTAGVLAGLGVRTIGDVAALGRERLQELFGAHGLRIHAYATGRDDEPVRAFRHPRSLSRESTLRGEPTDSAVYAEQLGGLAQQLEEDLARLGLAAGRVTLKVRFADLGTTTRSRTLPTPATASGELLGAALGLLERTPAGARPVRGLGIQLSSLLPAREAERQLELFRPG